MEIKQQITIYDKGIEVSNLYTNMSKDYRYGEYNLNEENRAEAVTTIAAISRGLDRSKNPKARMKKLLKEAAPDLSYTEILSTTDKLKGVAGRPLEYAPVIVKYRHDTLYTLDGNLIAIITNEDLFKLIRHSYCKSEIELGLRLTIYTNARALLHIGIRYEDIPYLDMSKVDIRDRYFVCKVKAPYFVFAQIRTHGLLSQVAVSARVTEDDEYWLPDNIIDKLQENLDQKFIDLNDLNCFQYEQCKYGDRLLASKSIEEVKEIFLELPIDKVKVILKHIGYKAEIYNRWPSFMEYKSWMMGGWLIDPKGWGHFLLEREAYPDRISSWVQEETKITANLIRKLIEKENEILES